MFIFPRKGVDGAQYANIHVVAGSINGPNPYTALSINQYLIVTYDNSSFPTNVTSPQNMFRQNDRRCSTERPCARIASICAFVP
jgi:hypothetical protein